MLQVLGIKTDLIRPGDDLAASLEKAMAGSGLALQDGDILVVSESTVATAEGRVVSLHDFGRPTATDAAGLKTSSCCLRRDAECCTNKWG